MAINQADQFAIELLQKDRIERGLQPLASHIVMSSIAERHTAWMDAHDRIDHSEGGTTTIIQKFNDAKFDWGKGQFAIGENETFSAGHAGNLEAQIIRLHQGYNNSSSHAAARFSPLYNAVGIDIRVGDIEGYGRAYFDAEEFGYIAGGPFAVGVAFADYNDDGIYNIGEGLPEVVVEFRRVLADGSLNGASTATTTVSGGYAHPLSSGLYLVRGWKPGGALSETFSVSISDENVKIDIILPPDDRPPIIRVF